MGDQQIMDSLAVYDAGAEIRFKNSVQGGSLLPWFKCGNLWVSTKVYCLNITHKELSSMDYLYGRPVRIDGTPYICRCPGLETRSNGMTEWAEILTLAGDLQTELDWYLRGFWGCGSDSEGEFVTLPRVGNPCYRVSRRNTWRASDVGFRPVLSPLAAEPVINSTLVGTELVVYHGLTALSGKLIDFSDYDLILSWELDHFDKTIYGGFANAQPDGTVVVDRSALDYLQIEGKRNFEIEGI